MSTDILFWYTGWTVWAVVAVALFAALLAGVAFGMQQVREWAAIMIISRAAGDMEGRKKLQKIIYHIGLPPGFDLKDKSFRRWWHSFIHATFIHGLNKKDNP